jgi:hypothetical protein
LVEANRGGRWTRNRERVSRGILASGAVEGSGFDAAADFQPVTESVDEGIGEAILSVLVLVRGRLFRLGRAACRAAKQGGEQPYTRDGLRGAPTFPGGRCEATRNLLFNGHFCLLGI